jgi:hypothetical protein
MLHCIHYLGPVTCPLGAILDLSGEPEKSRIPKRARGERARRKKTMSRGPGRYGTCTAACTSLHARYTPKSKRRLPDNTSPVKCKRLPYVVRIHHSDTLSLPSLSPSLSTVTIHLSQANARGRRNDFHSLPTVTLASGTLTVPVGR